MKLLSSFRVREFFKKPMEGSQRRPGSTVSSTTSTVTPYSGSAAALVRAALHGEEHEAAAAAAAAADGRGGEIRTSLENQLSQSTLSRGSARSFGDSRDFHSAASSRYGLSASSSLPTPQSSASSTYRSLPHTNNNNSGGNNGEYMTACRAQHHQSRLVHGFLDSYEQLVCTQC